MKLTLFFDHRYKYNSDGSIGSPSHYNYPLFKSRYLQIFDHVDVFARSPEPVGHRTSLGPGVDLVSAGSWHGALDYFRVKSSLKRLSNSLLSSPTAVLMIVPGLLGEIAHQSLERLNHPYSVEVVGDSNQSLAPGTVKHPLRPLVRFHYARQQRRLCSGAACCSYVTENALQENYPCSSNSFSTHCSSIELDQKHFSLTSKKYPQHKAQWNLINVGTMNVHYKGQVQLIEAIGLCRANGLDVKLALLGDGVIRAELVQLVEKLGLQSHVRFLGHLPPGESVRAELDRSDLFVLPSLTEGLPRALVEAMARGLACVGSDIPGIAELLSPASLTPIKDSQLLAQKIASFISQPDLLDSEAARNHLKAQDYLSSILTQRRVEFYRQIYDSTAAYYGNTSKGKEAA